MICTTTDSIEGKKVTQYLGVCSGEAVIGANVFKDMFASVRDVVGGRSGTYEKVLTEGKNEAMRDMIAQAEASNANAILGVDLDYEVLGKENGMMMVVANGTAVRLAG